jgi:hypothetical protein
MSAPNPSTPEATRPVAEVLRKALELLGPRGENWRQGLWNIYAHGSDKKHCAWYAIAQVIHGDFPVPYGESEEWARLLGLPDSGRLFAWNDAPERTFAEVKALFEKAISKAEAQ